MTVMRNQKVTNSKKHPAKGAFLRYEKSFIA